MQGPSVILAVFRTAFRNRELRRIQLAWAAFNSAEWGVWVALVVYAYARGGAFSASGIALVQLIPSALLAPFLGALADRYRPGRILLAAYSVMAVAMAAIALAMTLDAPTWVIFALAPIVNIAMTVPRPAQSALLPAVVRTPTELTAANVVCGWMDSLAIMVAPALAGVLIGIGGPPLAVAAIAGIALAAALLIVATPGTYPVADPADGEGIVGNALRGIGIIWRNRPVRTLTGLLGLQFVLVGALDILYVVLAISVLGMGESGTGYLNSAFGAGSLVGAALAATLVARRRLAPMLMAAIVMASLALLLLAVQPSVVGALLALGLIGVGRMSFDITGRILLQRAAPAAILAQVFALLESLMNFGLAIGAVLVPVLVETGGPQSALVGVAALLLLGVALAARQLWGIDAAATVPQVEIRLLKSITVFSPLPAPQLEGLARALQPLAVDAGTVIIREGDRGDCYYAIADGELLVSENGLEVNRVRRGDGVGEIALIRDSFRTATVTAVSPSQLYVLDKESFLTAISGQATAARECERVMAEHMARSAGTRNGSDPQPSPPQAGR